MRYGDGPAGVKKKSEVAASAQLGRRVKWWWWWWWWTRTGGIERLPLVRREREETDGRDGIWRKGGDLSLSVLAVGQQRRRDGRMAVVVVIVIVIVSAYSSNKLGTGPGTC